MATVSADGRTFIVNNKRVWIIGGVAGYLGIPRQSWKQRLKRAADAGLNTIVVPAVWAAHEPVPGKFTFEHDNDLAAFCRTAADLGLWVIVRVGPFVGERTALGGMPPWLLRKLDDNATPRTNTPSFIGPVSTWLNRLCNEIAPLQATRAGDDDKDPRAAGKPILAVQAEHHWFCGDHDAATEYFNQLTRYLREGGIAVPTITLNNMFAHAEGAIEAWAGYANLHTITRQLHGAWPDEPPIIGELHATTQPIFGEPATDAKSARAVQRALAETLSASGQFIIGDFAPSAPRAFAPGQHTHTPGAFATNAPDRAFVAEDASTGHAYHAARRICTFANSFARVLAAADPDRAGALISPGASAPPVSDERTGQRGTAPRLAASVTVEHLRGPAGAAVFLFADDTKQTKLPPIPITLPGGQQISAELGKLTVSWILIDVHLFSNKRLDYATLPALLHAGSALVLLGSPNATGVVSINGTSQQLKVPAGKKPAVHNVDGVTVALCNEQQADATIVRDTTIHIGAADTDEHDNPIPAPGFKEVTTIAHKPQQTQPTTSTPTTPNASKPRLQLSDWHAATAEPFTTGDSDRFARIEGPAPLNSLGTPDGYAWYRARFKGRAAKRIKASAFAAADRLHLFLDNAKPKLLGDGPDKPGRTTQLQLKAANHTLVALADSMGHPLAGFDLTTPKGLWGHIHETEPFKIKPTVESVGPTELLEHRSPIEGVHRGDTTHPDRLTWTFTHRKKSPLFLRMDHSDWTGIVFLNGEAHAAFTPGTPVSLTFDNATLNRGKNTIELAVTGRDEDAHDAYKKLASIATLHEGVNNITENAEWAFAAWEPPSDDEFQPFSKAALTGPAAKKLKGHPAWWRCTFPPAPNDITLRFDCRGLSKGHLILNGHNIARYWVATHDDKPVPPENELWLPPDTCNHDQHNSILIFDEHGFSPAKTAIKPGPLNP